MRPVFSSRYDSGIDGRRTFPVLSLLFIVVIAGIAGAYFDLSTAGSGGSNCNLSLEAGADTPPGLCLRTIAIYYPSANSTTATVPALVMTPGSTASISILYEPHSDLGDEFNPQSKLTGYNIPTAVDALTGNPNLAAVRFAMGTLVSEHDNWSIYSYSIITSNDSSGYYAIIVPFGPTLYPALVVEPPSTPVNASMMSLWGYVGSIESGETIIRSIFVGTSDLSIVNVTIPTSPYCMSRACNQIASSEFYEG